MTIDELHATGFKTVANANTPWRDEEVKQLEDAIRSLQEDESIMGDFASPERYIAWSVLGGSRTANAVSKKMKLMLQDLQEN